MFRLTFYRILLVFITFGLYFAMIFEKFFVLLKDLDYFKDFYGH